MYTSPSLRPESTLCTFSWCSQGSLWLRFFLLWWLLLGLQDKVTKCFHDFIQSQLHFSDLTLPPTPPSSYLDSSRIRIEIPTYYASPPSLARAHPLRLLLVLHNFLFHHERHIRLSGLLIDRGRSTYWTCNRLTLGLRRWRDIVASPSSRCGRT